MGAQRRGAFNLRGAKGKLSKGSGVQTETRIWPGENVGMSKAGASIRGKWKSKVP